MEIRPNIYWLKMYLPNNPLEHANAYLIRGNDGYVLIDTGWDTDESLKTIEEQLAGIGARLEDIYQIIGTHTHPDHYGMASRLKKLTNAQVALHYLERDKVLPGYRDINKLVREGVEWMRVNGTPADELFRKVARLRATRPELMNFTPLVIPDIAFSGGEIISTGYFDFRIMWTPGHSPGHICLYEPAQHIFISGDHILPDASTDVSLEPSSGPNPLHAYFSSLDEIAKLDVSLVLPGHGEPFTNLQERIRELIKLQEQRNAEILKTVAGEAKTAYQVSREITWIRNGNSVNLEDLSVWDERLAMLKVLAHLEAMKFRGIVEKSTREGTIYYQALK